MPERRGHSQSVYVATKDGGTVQGVVSTQGLVLGPRITPGSRAGQMSTRPNEKVIADIPKTILGVPKSYGPIVAVI